MTDNQDKKNAPAGGAAAGQSVKNNLAGHPSSSDISHYRGIEGVGQAFNTDLQTEALRRVQELAADNPDNPFMAQIARDTAAKWLHSETQSSQDKRVPDFSAMQPLPDFADFDPAGGASAGIWISQYVSYARSVSPMTPDLFHESAALWLASVAIARRLVLPMSFGEIYPNLFIVWLAETTLYRKSTALNIARNLARDCFPFLLASQDTTPEAFLSDMAGIQPANFNSLPITEQTAWESERNFSAQRGWVLDELSGLMAGAGRDYNAGLLESLLRFYDCDPSYTRSTLGRGRIVVKNSYLSLLGASTPAAMVQHFTAEGLWSNGWWPRFAILTPDKKPDWQDATAINKPAGLETGLKTLFNKLPNGSKWPEPPQQLVVSIGASAFDIWSKYNRALSHDLLTDDLPQQLYGTYGRLPTQALKIAMILTALDSSVNPKIETPHIIKALSIAETWRASAHRAISKATETDFTKTAERVLKIISRYEPNGASMREICRFMRDKHPHDIQLSMQEMIEAGMIEETHTGGDGKRGRPTSKYIMVRG